MAFMIPEYIESQAYHIDGPEGVRTFFAQTPGCLMTDAKRAEWLEFDAPAWFAELIGEDESNVWSVERDDSPKWYVRLSAPGYMDCTEWDGPHETKAEAMDALERAHDVNPETGELLSDEA